MDIKIIVAAHKKYRMPDDPMYLPLQVGAYKKHEIGYQRDDTGENISELNPGFCELTGLYWAWKNVDADYIGLVHYRRHFSMKRKSSDPFKNILKYSEIKPYLNEIKIFVPKKRQYFVESLYSHYAHTHYAGQLDETRKIISEKYPEYLGSYDSVVRQTSGYMFNMMVMDRKLLNDYCSWLFDILFELKKRIHTETLSAYQGRFYGRVSEIIFNAWICEQLRTGRIKKVQVKEIPYIYMEKTNWYKKGKAFLKAKLFGKKYEGSF